MLTDIILPDWLWPALVALASLATVACLIIAAAVKEPLRSIKYLLYCVVLQMVCWLPRLVSIVYAVFCG